MLNFPDYYNDILNEYPDYVPSLFEKNIDSDLNRTFPEEEFFQDTDNIEKLRNILIAFSRRNNSIGYTQGFNFIVGRILQIMEDEEKTFWIFVQIVEDILPVEYYSELSGVMVDSAVILDNIKSTLDKIYKHLSSKGIDICLNNLIFKWLVTLFIENTSQSIYLPILDSLFLYGDITLYKGAILLLEQSKDEILKCNNLCDASVFFENGFKNFNNKKFCKLLYKDIFELKKEEIVEYRRKKFPKIQENIKQINEFENKKKRKMVNSKCNLDWPYCVKLLGHTTIIDVMKHKLIEKPLIEEDYYNENHNVFKLAESGEKEQKNIKKMVEREKDEEKRKTIIYGNLLIERNHHKCDTSQSVSSRKEILGENSGKKSSFMKSFFDSCKIKDIEELQHAPSSDELMGLISNKNEIDHTKFIECIRDEHKEDSENMPYMMRRQSWFKKPPESCIDDDNEKKEVNKDNIKK